MLHCVVAVLHFKHVRGKLGLVSGKVFWLHRFIELCLLYIQPTRNGHTTAPLLHYKQQRHMPSVTVVEVDKDDDDEWGDEEEVVVWSNDLHATNGGGDSFRAHTVDIDMAVGEGRGSGGHPRGLLIASLANLAISYNVVRNIMECLYDKNCGTLGLVLMLLQLLLLVSKTRRYLLSCSNSKYEVALQSKQVLSMCVCK